jgi:hypothetical protein
MHFRLRESLGSVADVPASTALHGLGMHVCDRRPLRTSIQEGDGMKSIRNLGRRAAGTPILADDILEFHAARLLMLLKFCGVSGRIEGLTKLAKLDFFVRYPQFFEEVCDKLNVKTTVKLLPVESSMIRFHYGPWDKRYYHVLAYLEGKGLITVDRHGTGGAYQFKLTDPGIDAVTELAKKHSFVAIAQHMSAVKKVLGNKAGSTLKKLVYETFEDEVASRKLGEVIG